MRFYIYLLLTHNGTENISALSRDRFKITYQGRRVTNPLHRVREAKKLSQKEVINAIGMGAAQYSRIENGKTDPSVSTVEKIAKALGITMAELFSNTEDLKEVHSLNKTLMERVSLIDSLNKDEQKTIFTVLDAFISKRKFKNTLKSVLNDID